MSIGSYLGTTAETKELHQVVELRSRYYKTNYAKAKAAVIEFANEIGAEVKHIDDNHRELLLQNNRYHIIISFVQVTPIETSVDFKVEMYRIFGLHRPRKLIKQYYDFLDKNLQFKGVGLHP